MVGRCSFAGFILCMGCIHRSSSIPLPDAGYGFAAIYASSMVFQRESPIYVWGPAGSPPIEAPLLLSLGDEAEAVPVAVDAVESVWSATLPSRPANTAPAVMRLLRVSGGRRTVLAELTDILVGDVHLVAGQSNVGISVKYSNQYNATAEAENERAANRLGSVVRLMSVPQGGSLAPQKDLARLRPCVLPSAQCGCLPWSRSNASNVQGYSALGWYLAREALAIDGSVPIGIVQSDVPGTPIQKWTAAPRVPECTSIPAANYSEGTSSLYNAMIHPFVASKLAFAAITWYQGESNVGAPEPQEGALYYRCALPVLISDWRAKLPGPTRPAAKDPAGQWSRTPSLRYACQLGA